MRFVHEFNPTDLPQGSESCVTIDAGNTVETANLGGEDTLGDDGLKKLAFAGAGKLSARLFGALFLVVLVTGCDGSAKLESGDYADAATTSMGLATTGLAEMNPLVPGDPVVGAAVLLGLKYGGKRALIEAGHDPDTVNAGISSAGWGAACWNATLLGGGPTPVGATAAAACGLASWELSKPPRVLVAVPADIVVEE